MVVAKVIISVLTEDHAKRSVRQTTKDLYVNAGLVTQGSFAIKVRNKSQKQMGITLFNDSVTFSDITPLRIDGARDVRFGSS